MKGLFGGTISPEIINKVASGRTDTFATYQAKVTDMVNRLEAAKARVDECQKNVDALTLQSTKDTNNATVNTKPDELNRDQATTDLASAQERFERDKAETIAELNAQISELTSQISDLEKLISNAQSSTSGSGTTATPAPNSYTDQRNRAIENLRAKVKALGTADAEGSAYTGIDNSSSLDDIKNEYKRLYDKRKMIQTIRLYLPITTRHS